MKLNLKLILKACACLGGGILVLNWFQSRNADAAWARVYIFNEPLTLPVSEARALDSFGESQGIIRTYSKFLTALTWNDVDVLYHRDDPMRLSAEARKGFERAAAENPTTRRTTIFSLVTAGCKDDTIGLAQATGIDFVGSIKDAPAAPYTLSKGFRRIGSSWYFDKRLNSSPLGLALLGIHPTDLRQVEVPLKHAIAATFKTSFDKVELVYVTVP